MCYVIVTCRSMLWTLLTLVATLCIVASVITPQWLIGKPKLSGLRSIKDNDTTTYNSDRTYQPTIGLYNRCTKIHMFGDFGSKNCATYVTGFDMDPSDFSNFWKSSLIFFCFATILLTFTVITAVLSLCIRAICRKSLFTVSGLLQSIAG